MKILVIGGGGREHALVWKLKQSPMVERICVAPGNAGMTGLAECRPVAADDVDGLLALAKSAQIDLTVVGPEGPLAVGVVDAFQREGLVCIGPTARAAELEASKAFAKVFMQKYQIPTAHYAIFTDPNKAKAYVRTEPLPIVIKADGLAQGKGVVVATTLKEADEAIDAQGGRRIVIEQCLKGEEVSCIALVDGEHCCCFPSVQDHKALKDGDTGPNTGGMGAYSPAPIMTEALTQSVRERILEPTVRGMAREGRPFVGFLYAGLMIVDGHPYVLEYNVRLGDPEAQALLVRLRSDLVPLLRATADRTLSTITPLWDERPSACVVMTAAGYPETVVTGTPIRGLDHWPRGDDCYAFHAGTAVRDGQIVTAGGRVLGVTALGRDIRDAVERAYAGVARIQWEGMHYRKDIGWRALRTITNHQIPNTKE